MIVVADGESILATARAALCLPEAGAGAPLDAVYLGAAVRRLAGFLCPCSPKTLIRSMKESHRYLSPDVDALAERVEETIETLLACGDFLELSDVAAAGDDIKSTWVFGAPPSFVLRDSGNVFIVGLSADEATPLPAEMLARVEYRGAVRFLRPGADEDLKVMLRDLGWRELSASAWRRHPRLETAVNLIAHFDTKLSAQRAISDVPDLRLLDGARPTRRYRDRWVKPKGQSGRYIIRRPQDYGADLWGYAELVDGVPHHLIDLPLPGTRWRGCDTAWRLQMAMDALAGRPQQYRKTHEQGTITLSFFSPIPDWARRRLALVGEEVASGDCLMSFQIGSEEIDSEERFLREMLFLEISKQENEGEAR